MVTRLPDINISPSGAKITTIHVFGYFISTSSKTTRLTIIKAGIIQDVSEYSTVVVFVTMVLP